MMVITKKRLLPCLVFILAVLAMKAMTGRLQAMQMTEFTLPDRTASAVFPPTWQAVGEKGCIIGRGPDGVAILGMLMNYVDANEWVSSMNPVDQGPYLSPSSYVTHRLGEALLKAGLPVASLRLVREVPAPGFPYPAIAGDLDIRIGQHSWRAVFVIATWRVYGTSRWGAYISGVTASQERFDASFLTLWQIFTSFRPQSPYRAGDDPGGLGIIIKQLGGYRTG